MVSETTEEDGPKMWARDWGLDVRNARLVQGLSIDDLARLSGVHKSVISRLENYGRDPKLSTAMAISDALGIGIEW